jgi:hypothetical protein
LTVVGGVGIGGNVYIGGIVTATNFYVDGSPVVTAATLAGFVSINGATGTITISAGTDTAINTSGTAITISNTGNLQSITNRGSATSNQIGIQNTNSSTSTTTGALVVTGGVGIGGNLNVGSNVKVVGVVTATNFYVNGYAVSTSTAGGGGSFTGGSVSGATQFTNATLSTGTTTGAVTVIGGVGIGGNLYVGNTLTVLSTLSSTSSVSQNALYVVGGLGVGSSLYVTGPAVFNNNVTFSGTTTYVLSTNTVYTDNIIELHYAPSWAVNDNKDIGLRFHYYDTADRNAFLGQDNATGYLEWLVNSSPDNTNNITGTNGTFRLGSIILTDTTASNATNTGALTVVGGVGIGGNVYVGGVVTATNFYVNGYAVSTSTGGGGGSLSAQYFGASLGTVTTLNFATGTTATLIGGVLTIQATNTGTSFNTGTLVAQAVSATSLVVGTWTFALSSTGSVTLNGTPFVSGSTPAASGTGTTTTFVISNTTQSTGTNSGALVVAGGVGIGGNLTLGGVITTFNKNTDGIRIGTNYVSGGNGTGDYGSLGFYGNLNGANDNKTAEIRSYNDGVFYGSLEFFVRTNGATAVGTDTTRLIKIGGQTNNVIVYSTVSSTSTTTGALQVVGGVGVGGNLNVGGTVTGGGVRTTTTSTAPANPTVGDIWYYTNSDVIYRYTNDGTNSYWIDITGPTYAITTNTSLVIGVAQQGNTQTVATSVGYLGLPQNPQTGTYTLSYLDQGGHVYLTGSTATVLIPANTVTSFAIGTTIAFIASANTTGTIKIQTDNLYLGGSGTTGTRTLSQYGMATVVKVTTNTWFINGTGLT